MPIGQTLADILGGLVAINKGDPSGAQAFTGQGRQDLANQRANTRAATELQHQALDVAHVNPEANRYLQEWLQPGLQNQQTRATTKFIGEEAGQRRAQTQGQQLQNLGTAQNLESFGPMGGEPFARFSEEAKTGAEQRQHLGASSALLGVQTEGQQYSQLQQQALDMMAQTYGYQNHQHMQEMIGQGLKQQEMQLGLKEHQMGAAATMFGHLYGPMTGSGVTDAQRQMAAAGGVNLAEDPADVQKRQMAQEAMQLVKQKQAEKGAKKAKTGGLSQLIPQAQSAKPQGQPQPGAQQAIPLTQELVKRLYQPPPEELNLHKAMTMLRQLQDLGLMQGGQ